MWEYRDRSEGVRQRGFSAEALPALPHLCVAEHSTPLYAPPWLEPWNSRTVWWGWRAMGWTRELWVVGWYWEIVVCDWGAVTGGWSAVKWMVLGRCGWA